MSGIASFVCAMFLFIGMHVAAVDYIPKPSALPSVVEYTLNCFAEEQKDNDLVLVEKISDYDACQQISRLGFLFDFYKPLSLPAARRLITGMVTDLVTRINNNSKLKTYLSSSPFTPADVVIRLRLRSKDCGFIYPQLGNIAYISAMEGMIIYDTINSFTYDLDTFRTESFADALNILKAQARPQEL